MKTKLNILFFAILFLIYFKNKAQTTIAAGYVVNPNTYSYTALGGASAKNWANPSNWAVWTGTAWTSPASTAPTGGDVIIDINKIPLTYNTTYSCNVYDLELNGNASINSLTITATNSLTINSLTTALSATTVARPVRIVSLNNSTTNAPITLQINGNLNIDNNVNPSKFSIELYESNLASGGILSLVSNTTIPATIHTNSVNIYSNKFYINGNYSLLDRINHLPMYSDGSVYSYLGIDGQFNSNNNTIFSYFIAIHAQSSATTIGNYNLNGSELICTGFRSSWNMTSNTASITLTDQIGSTGRYLAYTWAAGGVSFNSTPATTYSINTIYYKFSKAFNPKGSLLVNNSNTLTVLNKLETGRSLDIRKNNLTSSVCYKINNFLIDSTATITFDGANYSYFTLQNSLLPPNTCTAPVQFISNLGGGSFYYPAILTCLNSQTVAYCGFNNIGSLTNTITANYSNDFGGNSGITFTVNPLTKRTLAWCCSGNNNKWDNPANWKQLLPSVSVCGAACLPTALDSLVFDPAYLSSTPNTTNTTINLLSPGYMAGITFTNSLPGGLVWKFTGTGIMYNTRGIHCNTNNNVNLSFGNQRTIYFVGDTVKYGAASYPSANIYYNNTSTGLAFQTNDVNYYFIGAGKWRHTSNFYGLINSGYSGQTPLIYTIRQGRVIFGNNTIEVGRMYILSKDGTAPVSDSAVVHLDNSIIRTLLGISAGAALQVKNNNHNLRIIPGNSIINLNNGVSGGNNLFDFYGATTMTTTPSILSIAFNSIVVNTTGGTSNLVFNKRFNDLPIPKINYLKIASPTNMLVTTNVGALTTATTVNGSAMFNVNGYANLNTLDLQSGQPLSLQQCAGSSSLSTYPLLINTAILTNSTCAGPYTSLFSNSTASVSANIRVPATFTSQPNKLNITNVTVNSGGIPSTTSITAMASSTIGNCAGWLVTPQATRYFYWNGEGVTQNWNDPRNWNVFTIAPYGGNPLNYTVNAGPANDATFNTFSCTPGPQDSVYFTPNSFPTTSVTNLVGSINVGSISWLNGTPTATWSASSGAYLYIGTGLYIDNALTKPIITYSNSTEFITPTGTVNLKFSGVTFIGNVKFTNNGTWVFKDNFNLCMNAGNGNYGSILYHTSGNIISNNNIWNTNTYSSPGTLPRSLSIQNSTINLTSSASNGNFDALSSDAINISSNNYSLSALNSVINFTPIGTAASGNVRMNLTGGNTLNFHRIYFLNSQGSGEVRCGSNNYTFKYLEFTGNSLITSNTAVTSATLANVETLKYAKYSINTIESSNRLRVDWLDAVSDVCGNLKIQSSVPNSVAYICDPGLVGIPNTQLTALFTDIKDINSSSCSTSGIIDNGSIVNSSGWTYTSSPISYGFTTNTLNPTCNNLPLNLNSTSFYATTVSTFSWSTGATTPTINITSPGIYTLDVTYGKPGCHVQDYVVVNVVNNLAGTNTITTPLCFGNGNASINYSLTSPSTNSATGIMHSYNYGWLPASTVTTSSLSNITAGNYTLIITDNTSPISCSLTQVFTVTQPASLTVNTVNTPTLCAGANSGTANVTVSGGTSAYTYTWANSGGTLATSPNISSLTSGTYSVVVKDANNCITTKTIQINAVSNPILSITGNTSICNGQSSNFTVNGAITYTWNTASNATTIIASPGVSTSYSVTGTDANGCSNTNSVSLIVNANPTLSVIGSSVLCSGQTASMSVSGANLYTWSTGSNASSITTIPASTTVYTITGLNTVGNCVNAITYTVNVSALPVLAVSGSNQICNGSNATLTASGANTYSWSNGATTNTIFINPTTQQTYTVVGLIGTTSCSNTTTYTVDVANTPTLNISINSVLICGGNTGTLIANSNNGATNYNWSGSGILSGNNTPSITVNASGQYSLTATQTTGTLVCSSAMAMANVTVTPVLNATYQVDNVKCFNQATGATTVSAIGGTPIYNYSWIPNVSTQSLITNQAAGTYTCIITDINNCSTQNIITINQPNSALTSSIASTASISCFGGSNGSANVNANGGTSSYSYSWSPITSSSNTISNLSQGNYTCTITDANGCVDKQLVTIAQPNSITSIASTTANNSCTSPNGIAVMNANGGIGALSINWDAGTVNNFTNTSLPTGVSNYTVTDDNGCTITGSINIGNTALPVLTLTSLVNSKCNASNNGSAQFIASGGTPTYNYLLQTSVTTNTFNSGVLTNLSAGEYTLNLIDAGNCKSTKTFTVTEPDKLYANPTIQNACPEESNGNIDLNLSGGTPSYSINWSNGQTGTVLQNIIAGSYTATVSDNNLCKLTQTIEVKAQSDLGCNVVIPTFLSPDGDGKNDTWVIKGIEGYPNNKITVLNRWGNIVMERKTYNNDWDGRNEGSFSTGNGYLPAGTYFFIVDLGTDKKPIQGYMQLEN